MKVLSWSRYHYRSWLSSCVVRRRRPRDANRGPDIRQHAYSEPSDRRVGFASSLTPEAAIAGVDHDQTCRRDGKSRIEELRKA